MRPHSGAEFAGPRPACYGFLKPRVGGDEPLLGFSPARAMNSLDSFPSLAPALNPWQGVRIRFHKTNLFFHLFD